MDESIADQITRDEWGESYKLGQTAFKQHFDEMLLNAQNALKPLISKDKKLLHIVDEQTTKILQENQAAVIMLRAAAFTLVE